MSEQTWKEVVEARLAELLNDPVFVQDFGHLGEDELYEVVASGMTGEEEEEA